MTDGTAADLVARVRQVAEADARRQQRTHIEHNGATIAKYQVDGVPYYMAWRGAVQLRHEPFTSADEARAFIDQGATNGEG